MKLISTITSFVALFAVTSAIHVRQDSKYDNPKALLSSTACGVLAKKYHTFDSLKSFPFIAAAQATIPQGDSDVISNPKNTCGTCWQISYQGKSVFVEVVDHIAAGFSLSSKAMTMLSGGVLDAQVTTVDMSYCTSTQ
jgi:hypothetical protein